MHKNTKNEHTSSISKKKKKTYLIHAKIDHFLHKSSYFLDIKPVKKSDHRKCGQWFHLQIIHHHVRNGLFHIPFLHLSGEVGIV